MKRWMIASARRQRSRLRRHRSAARAEGEDQRSRSAWQDAQRRLEDAAREVAELCGEAAGPGAFRQFEYFLPGPRRAMLGVNIGGAEPSGGGVRVESVSPGGPAAEAGVKAGDVIVAIEAKPVTTGRELVRAMEAIEPGEKVELGLQRDGKPLKLAVEARPLDRVFIAGPGRAARAFARCPRCRAVAGAAVRRRCALAARRMGRCGVRHADARPRPLLRRRQGRAGRARAGRPRRSGCRTAT